MTSSTMMPALPHVFPTVLHMLAAAGDAAPERVALRCGEERLVVNGIAIAVKATEMALALYRLTGSVVSRRGTYAKASAECIEAYLGSRW